MTGRPVGVAAVSARTAGPRRLAAIAVAAAALIALGVAIGSRIAAPQENVATPVTVTVSAAPKAPGRTASAPPAPTRASAIEAAATYVSELDGSVLLDPARLRALVDRIASPRTGPGLVTAYEQAAVQARERLGLGTVPEPVVILRAAPVGYRVDSYSSHSATVAIWRVGVIGSGATVDPQQSWATETVRLLWSDDGWKVASLSSSPGPTPPLPTSVAPTARGDLFRSVPQFQEFSGAAP